MAVNSYSAPESVEYALLHRISSNLSSSLNLKESLSSTFEVLKDYVGVVKGVLTLVDPISDELHVEIVFGLNDSEKNRHFVDAQNKLSSEALTKQIPLVLSNLTKSQETLNKIGIHPSKEGCAFACFPITLGKEHIGTIGLELSTENEAELAQHIKLLSFFALMIAQDIKMKRLMEKEKEALRAENIILRDELKDKYNISNMIGNSSAMHQVYESIIQVANSNATVLIRGDSGTGKELVAHAIHYNSPRANGPLIKINCGAIPESLIEAELFGYEKGAFTDAQEQKIGKFEAANTGTIFLDEIGELSPGIQVKLLRVLQEKEFERIGGIKPIKVNVRVITATNRDLEKELQNNRFRQDLYYRLNVFPIFLPALRERKTDILLLAEHFLEKYAAENHKRITRISSLAIDLLNSYHWPGNVRELENCIERAVLLCKGDTIQATNLPPTLQRVDTTTTPLSSEENLSLEELVSNFEREVIIDALKKTRGNKSKAAKYLKTTQRIIGYKIQNLRVDSKFSK